MEKTEVLNKFVETMLGMLQDASAFAKAEIPQVCKEIILYGRVKEAIGLLICVAVVTIAVKKAPPHFKKWSDAGSYDGEEFMVAGIGFTISGIIAAMAGLCSLQNVILAWVAPRLYLIEYFKGLVK